jgi:hypothetical protein
LNILVPFIVGIAVILLSSSAQLLSKATKCVGITCSRANSTSRYAAMLPTGETLCGAAVATMHELTIPSGEER